MSLVYLDANALMRWAEGESVSPTPDQTAAAAQVCRIISDVGNTVVISELTFIEFHDQVLRYRSRGMVEWTDAWVNITQSQLMEWIEGGRISVHPSAPRSIDVAMSYISMARDAGRSLKAADAIHLDRVIEWAHDTEETVVLVTGDRAFSKFLEAVPAATRFLRLRRSLSHSYPSPEHRRRALYERHLARMLGCAQSWRC